MGLDSLACLSMQGASSSVFPRVALWPPAGKQTDAHTIQSQSQGSSQLQAPSIKVSVKLSFHSSGNVAAKCEYEPVSMKVPKIIFAHRCPKVYLNLSIFFLNCSGWSLC